MADTLTITDNRTGKQYEITIQDGTIRAADLRQIKVTADEFGMMTYDPAFMNTAACRSKITFIDGDKGILLYRGYPIDQLAEHSDFLETSYLLLFGELPSERKLEAWTREIDAHVDAAENLQKFVEGFRQDAHPMGMFLSLVGDALDLLPGREEHLRPASAPPADGADDCPGARASPRTPTATSSAGRSSCRTTI